MKILVILAVVCAVLTQVIARSAFGNKDYSDEKLNEMANLLTTSGQFLSSSLRRSHNENNDVSQWSEAESYMRKINTRLNNSEALANKGQIKHRIQNLAKEKLQNCKTSSGTSLDMGCVGRQTGQMMQMIAEVEKSNRALPNGNTNHNARSDEKW